MNSQIQEREHNLVTWMRRVLLLPWILLGLVGLSAHADELKPETAAAFDRYIAATEARMDDDLRSINF